MIRIRCKPDAFQFGLSYCWNKFSHEEIGGTRNEDYNYGCSYSYLLTEFCPFTVSSGVGYSLLGLK